MKCLNSHTIQPLATGVNRTDGTASTDSTPHIQEVAQENIQEDYPTYHYTDGLRPQLDSRSVDVFLWFLSSPVD